MKDKVLHDPIPSNPQSLIPNPSCILDSDLRKQIEQLLPHYPTKQAATLPALHLINAKLRYVPPQAVVELAELLELAPAQVQDTLSFYGFFKQDKPQGEYRVWVCRSISCAACGGEELLQHLSDRLGIAPGETTPDGRLTLEYAECLGACDMAPAMLVQHPENLHHRGTPPHCNGGASGSGQNALDGALVNETLHGEMTKERVDDLVKDIIG